VPLPGNGKDARTVATGIEHTDDSSTAEFAKAEASGILMPIQNPSDVTLLTAERKEDKDTDFEALIEHPMESMSNSYKTEALDERSHSEEAMEGHWTDALKAFKNNRYDWGECCLERYFLVAKQREAKSKEAEETNQMKELRAKAGEHEKSGLERMIADYKASAAKDRSLHKLEDAALMDGAIARSEKTITIIDQFLQKLDGSENSLEEKYADETTGTA